MSYILTKNILTRGRLNFLQFKLSKYPSAKFNALASPPLSLSPKKAVSTQQICRSSAYQASTADKSHLGLCAVFSKRGIHKGSALRNEEDKKRDDKKKSENESEQLKLQAISLAISALATYFLYVLFRGGSSNDDSAVVTVEWTDFVNNYLKKGEVNAIKASEQTNSVYIALHPGAMVNGKPTSKNVVRYLKLNIDADKLEAKIQQVEKELGIPSSESVTVIWRDESTVSAVLKFVTFVGIFYIFRKINSSTAFKISTINPFEAMSKVKYTRGDKASSTLPKIRFKDIAGMREAKVEIKEYVEYLKNPTRFQNLGAKIPRGALLLGPPGCGKTLLAKAVATESEVPFLVMAGSDFVEMIGGLGASRIRTLFKEARGLKPCIIYIDEIDALGRKRSGAESHSGSESEHTLNQLLVEMDGMADNSGVIMLASTNRADVLDQALLRPGRFDRHISIDLPTLLERKDLFSMYLSKLNLDKESEEIRDFLAQATPGMSGADIANVCNEAAINAAREGNTSVKEANLMYALDRLIAGQAKVNTSISKQERKTIAYHECGHVLVSWLLENTDALLKVSIIPRTTAALGFAQYMPSDKKLYSKEDLFQRMCVLLGGRAAEAIVFNKVTTGAQDDLNKVRQLAYGQIKSYGMGDSVGLLSFPSDESKDYQAKPYSKHLQSMMDMEAQQMIAQAYQTAEQLIRDNREKLDTLCHLLLRQEEMTYDEVKAAIGPPPHGEKQTINVISA